MIDSYLTYLSDTKIKEIAEDSKHITIKIELKFKDGNSFIYDCYIEKNMIHVGNINAMVL